MSFCSLPFDVLLAIHRKLDARDVVRSGMVSFHLITYRPVFIFLRPTDMHGSRKVYERSSCMVGPVAELRHEESRARTRDARLAFPDNGRAQKARDTPRKAVDSVESSTVSI